MRNAAWVTHKLKSSAGRNFSHLRYADNTTLTAESEEEQKSLFDEGEKLT